MAFGQATLPGCLVQDDSEQGHFAALSTAVNLDVFMADSVCGLIHYHFINFDPTAHDHLLGFAARAFQNICHALGQANAVGFFVGQFGCYGMSVVATRHRLNAVHVGLQGTRSHWPQTFGHVGVGMRYPIF